VASKGKHHRKRKKQLLILSIVLVNSCVTVASHLIGDEF
jgi:hypothetical protein